MQTLPAALRAQAGRLWGAGHPLPWPHGPRDHATLMGRAPPAKLHPRRTATPLAVASLGVLRLSHLTPSPSQALGDLPAPTPTAAPTVQSPPRLGPAPLHRLCGPSADTRATGGAWNCAGGVGGQGCPWGPGRSQKQGAHVWFNQGGWGWVPRAASNKGSKNGASTRGSTLTATSRSEQQPEGVLETNTDTQSGTRCRPQGPEPALHHGCSRAPGTRPGGSSALGTGPSPPFPPAGGGRAWAAAGIHGGSRWV